MSSIFHRTSVREYEARGVEKEKVELLLRAAMAAPSAANQQPWEFFVVTVPDVRKELSKVSPYSGCAAKAPLLIVPAYRTSGLALPDYAHIDMSAATENLLLEADELGLGAVWLGIAPETDRMDQVDAILHIPPTLRSFAIIAIGYPVREQNQKDRFDAGRVHLID